MKSQKFILNRLMLQLAGSWSFTPIAFLCAQLLGQGNNVYITAFLLIGSLVSGLTLFLNEVLAPVLAKNEYNLNSRIIFIQISFLVFVVLGAFDLVSPSSSILPKLGAIPFSLIAVTTSFSMLYSMKNSEIVCKRVSSSTSEIGQSQYFIIGLMPTAIVQLLIIFLALASEAKLFQLVFFCFAGLLVIPSIAQYCYLMHIDKSNIKKRYYSMNFIRIKYALLVLLFLVILSCLGSFAKLHISSSPFLHNYSNLVFLLLNMLASFSMAVSKSSFLARPHLDSKKNINHRASARPIFFSITILAILLFFIDPNALGNFAYYIFQLVLVFLSAILVQVLIFWSRKSCFKSF